MSELEYGKKIGMSYKAILQMHRDAKKLLVALKPPNRLRQFSLTIVR